MEEASSGVLEDGIDWSLHVQLGILDDIGADAIDRGGGIGIDVAVSVEVSGCVDLCVSEISQSCWREALGCTITMAMEDIDTEDGLLRLKERDQGRKSKELFGKHLDGL